MISSKELKNIPDQPGVYLMKDQGGTILYIGKALSLKKRVSSYFRKTTPPNPKLESLVPQIHHLDYILTSSELEALILENNLIKKHHPKYNVVLRDDKNYPYLCLTMKEKYPRLLVTRKVKKDGNVYFGPYIPASALRKMLKTIYQLFPLRQCKSMPKRSSPCLQYQMKRCHGPCAGMTDHEAYLKIVHEVKLFLLGKQHHLLKSLERQMHEAAENLQYEKAALIRDRIRAFRQTLQPQSVFSTHLKNKDIINLTRSTDLVCLVVFFVRHGQLLGKKEFFIQVDPHLPSEEALVSFIEQFYLQDILIPRTIVVGLPLPCAKSMEDWLTKRRGSPVTLVSPKSGEGKRQLDLVQQNAQFSLDSYLKKTTKEDPALRLLAQDLHLPHLPVRIESFDISNFAGDEAVGSMVCWINNQPAKSEYRRFKIRTVTDIDDYAMIREVIHRRYQRRLEEGEALPELILIDGGKGHLQAGLQALSALKINDPWVVSLAKKEEEIFLPQHSEPLRLPRHSASLQILQKIRDETHRFAITYHRERRRKKLLTSQLLQIEGIGPARQKALLRHFGSIQRLKQVSQEELSAVPSIDQRTAHRIYEYFHPQAKEG